MSFLASLKSWAKGKIALVDPNSFAFEIYVDR